nr:MAG: major capsid protein [Microvirus sp.]
MKNLFNSIKLNKPKRNSFDLTHDVKLSASMGNLTPILTMECVPGDKFNIGCESLIRFAPLIAPVMHRMDVTMHYFFVPNRILWDNWEKFITDANSGIVAPYLEYFDNASFYPASIRKAIDYFGVPPIPTAGTSTDINALPFAAYQCIYNEFYRDQNLVAPINYKLADGDNTTDIARVAELCSLRKRAWEHDYFTASLPFAQKGAAVDIPLGQINAEGAVYVNNATAGTLLDGTPYDINVSNNTTTVTPANEMFAVINDGTLEPTSINDLRRAFRLQEWLEKNARGGTRYIESILSHFGVKSSDARLQRPEYITGVKSPVIISEVLNTTGEDGGLPQGTMAGHGIAVSSGKSGSYYCEEHGFIIGIMSILPKTAYQQGIPKQFLKKDTLDYYFPSFANIGEQEVKNIELFAYTATAEDTFGYVPRYAEYKYMPSRVAGDFRTILAYWHLGRIFDTQPALNQTFIECNPENTTRIFAVEDGTDPLFCHVLNKIQAVRPMPKFGTPMF